MANRKIKADTLRKVAAGSVTTSYAALGASLGNVWIQIVLKNTTDQTLWVSENGTDDHYELPAGTQEFYDFEANTTGDTQSGKAIGTQFYVKAASGALPTSGSIILGGQYL